MGQYYNVVIGSDFGYRVYDRSVDGKYTMAKLTEHSWFGNHFCDAIGELLYNNPKHVIWCGDYAEEDDLEHNVFCKKHNISYDDIWGEAPSYKTVKKVNFNWVNKYIVNHTKHEYIKVNYYWNRSCVKIGENDTWVLNPIPILTSIGNGRGGGDYSGSNMDYVGYWAGDCISVQNFFVKSDYSELKIYFKEKAYLDECE